MRANIILDNVRVYDVEKWDILIGQMFTINMVDAPEGIRWFSDNDSVLSLSVDGTSAKIEAKSVGSSDIQIQLNGSIIKTMFVEVFDAVAVSLNAKASKPELK
jgi:hypothetical protein